MSICKASEIPRNEAYIEVRRSDLPCYIGFAVSHSEDLTGRGMRVTQPFDFAQCHELVEWQMDFFRRPQRENSSIGGAA